MRKINLGLIITLLIFSLFLFSCKKFAKQGFMPTAGIALTFDDNNIDNWYNYLPLLDSANAKATFYISNYKKLTDVQKHKLAIIQSHGNEIAFHTSTHVNMVEYVTNQRHSIDELIKKEIENGLALMNKDGFYPKTFAYPYGAHNEYFDKILLKYFKSVRALNGTKDFSKSQVATAKNTILYSLGIDKSSNRSDVDIMKFLNASKDNNTCAVILAHDINSASKFSVTLPRLKQILNFVNQNNLKFYTALEISEN